MRPWARPALLQLGRLYHILVQSQYRCAAQIHPRPQSFVTCQTFFICLPLLELGGCCQDEMGKHPDHLSHPFCYSTGQLKPSYAGASPSITRPNQLLPQSTCGHRHQMLWTVLAEFLEDHPGMHSVCPVSVPYPQHLLLYGKTHASQPQTPESTLRDVTETWCKFAPEVVPAEGRCRCGRAPGLCGGADVAGPQNCGGGHM
jgi:hypothetical protein